MNHSQMTIVTRQKLNEKWMNQTNIDDVRINQTRKWRRLTYVQRSISYLPDFKNAGAFTKFLAFSMRNIAEEGILLEGGV